MLWWPDADCLGTNALLRKVSFVSDTGLPMLIGNRQWRARTAALATVLVAIGFAVTETILILTLRVRGSTSRDHTKTDLFARGLTTEGLSGL
jgi:RsiW-degrading membrane proteinase PrsW (M82 family)